MPGGVPGASASREMAAADSELLREAMGWLVGGVTGRAPAWLELPMPCITANAFHDRDMLVRSTRRYGKARADIYRQSGQARLAAQSDKRQE